jgi:hypothetical protein
MNTNFDKMKKKLNKFSNKINENLRFPTFWKRKRIFDQAKFKNINCCNCYIFLSGMFLVPNIINLTGKMLKNIGNQSKITANFFICKLN